MQKTMELHNRIWILFLTGVLLTFSVMIWAAWLMQDKIADCLERQSVIFSV